MKTKTLWAGFILCVASGLLYWTNDWPTGTPPDNTNINLTWPIIYTGATLIFISLLILGTRKPPLLFERATKHISEIRAVKLLLFAGLLFHSIVAIALLRRLSRDSWTPSEIGIACVIGVSVALLVWVLIRSALSIRLTLIYIGAAGLLLRLAAFGIMPLDREQADMLPLIQVASKTFLVGSSPYRLYDLHSWPLPLTYLPIKWLAYVPTIAAGLDLRLTNAIAEIVVLGVFIFSRPITEKDNNDLSVDILLSGLLYLSPAVIIFDWYTEFPVFWGITLTLYGFLLREQFWMATVVWGLSLATSPLNWVISPFIAAYLAGRMSLHQWLKLCALAAFTALVITLPFVLWSPQEFVFGTFTWFNDLSIAGRSSWILANHRQMFQIGFAGWFWYLGWENALKPVQALLVLLVFAVFWQNRHKVEWLLLSSLWAYTLFIFFNVIIWPYFYVLPLWLLALFVISAKGRPSSRGS